MSMSKAYVQAPDSERDYEDVPPSSYHATHAPPPPPSGGGEARMLSIEEIEKRRMRANWFRIIVSLVTIIVWLCAGATVFWLIEGMCFAAAAVDGATKCEAWQWRCCSAVK